MKNAYRAYEAIGTLDPYSLEELKRLHGIITYLTVEESGAFRQGGEGVFDGDRCIFIAPPAKLVPDLMDQLFTWMRSATGEIHPLILSSVFHYEFVFIQGGRSRQEFCAHLQEPKRQAASIKRYF